MVKFNLNYFNSEDTKTQSRKEFKVCIFSSFRLGVYNINCFLQHTYAVIF